MVEGSEYQRTVISGHRNDFALGTQAFVEQLMRCRAFEQSQKGHNDCVPLRVAKLSSVVLQELLQTRCSDSRNRVVFSKRVR